MGDVLIRGRSFTKEEVIEYGNKAIAKKQKVLRIIALALLGITLLGVAMGLVTVFGGELLVDSETGESIEPAEAAMMFPTYALMFGVPGVILLILSFAKSKKDPYEKGLEYLNKHFPLPIGFDGKVASILEGDKIISLSNYPVTKLIISSTENKIQIYQHKKYTRILEGKDILDYEIKVDNEVVVTSQTVTKKGVGKAVVGGIFLGGAGAVAGSIGANSKTTTSQSQKEIQHYTLMIKLNDIFAPSFVIQMDSLQVVEEVVATLAIICKADAREEAVEESSEPKLDKFDEIKKYKQLFDDGIITELEFEIEKRRILG